jgi:hypothetical protein
MQQIIDLEFSYRLLKKYSILILNEKLLRFRLHKEQASEINNGKMDVMEEHNYLDKYVIKKFRRFLPERYSWKSVLRRKMKTAIKITFKR